MAELQGLGSPFGLLLAEAMQRKFSFLAQAALGASILAGAAAGLMLLVSLIPGLAELTRLDQTANLYKELVRKPALKLLLGTDVDLPWSNVGWDVAALWLCLFIGVNVFVYLREEVFLWGHIRKNYCGRRAQRWWGAGLCTLGRWSLALAATPFACSRIFLASLGSPHTLFTSCFITVEPAEIARYLKYLGMCITALAAIAAVTGRLLILPS